MGLLSVEKVVARAVQVDRDTRADIKSGVAHQAAVDPKTLVADYSKAPDWFHAGQLRAWASTLIRILVLAGTQAGKTVFGPFWLLREIQRCGPGDYAVVGPTMALLQKKAMPAFLRLFRRQENLGDYVGSPVPHFRFSEYGLIRIFGSAEEPCTVYFGYGSDPDTLESMTLKGVWCDESGQPKFKLGSKEALDRRVSIYGGRILHTTTPYDLGWLKTKIWDPWRQADGNHPEIDVINFESRMNPTFPVEAWERAERDLPLWKFKLFYCGIFTRPAGVIYDTFDETVDVVDRFEIPDWWIRATGNDFGDVNTAAVFGCIDPDDDMDDPTLYVYKTYHTGGKSIEDHVKSLVAKEPYVPVGVGGAPSEDEVREKYNQAGYYIARPQIKSVELGIDAVYSMFKRGKLKIFRDLKRLIQDLLDYSREIDDNGEPTKEIKDKSKYHRLDGLRYICSEIQHNGAFLQIGDAEQSLPPADERDDDDYEEPEL